MKRIRVLITGISSTNSIAFLRALKKQNQIDFHISGTDIYERHLSVGAQFCDDFHQIVSARDPNFANQLLQICLKNEIEILVPIIDEEFPIILENRTSFENQGIKIILPPNEAIEICTDKIKTFHFLKKMGFPTVPIFEKTPQPDSLPVVMKPVRGRGSHGLRHILKSEDLKAVTPAPNGYFFQKTMSGTEYTVDTFSDLNGNTLVAVPRNRIEVREGKCTKAQIVHNKAVEDMAKKICDDLKMTGPACLQCFVGDDQIPYFFDLNPRIGSATTITIEAGVNIPLLAIKSLLNLKIDSKELIFKNHLIMLRYWSEVFTYHEPKDVL